MHRRDRVPDRRPPHTDHHGPRGISFEQLHDRLDFVPPAGTDPRAAARFGYQCHGFDTRHSHVPITDSFDLENRPPYPSTPLMPRVVLPASQAPHVIEPETFMSGPAQPPGPIQSTDSYHDPAFPTTRNSHIRHDLIRPRQPSAQHQSRPARLTTSRSKYRIIRPLRAESSRYTNDDMDHLLIEDVETDELFVQKRWHDSTQCLRRRAAVESTALRQIMYAGSSLHIIGIFETFYEPSLNCAIVEYCDSGTLDDFITRHVMQNRSITEAFAWHVLSSLASALCVCHYGTNDPDQSLVAAQSWTTLYHFDVQPVNIWLSSRGAVSVYPRVVLGNFSCVSRRAELESGEADNALLRYGTPAWLPPEACRNHRHQGFLGKYTDIWQVGAVTKAMCCLARIPDTTEVEKPCGSSYSFALNKTISWCMDGDWMNRPTAVDLIREIWRSS